MRRGNGGFLPTGVRRGGRTGFRVHSGGPGQLLGVVAVALCGVAPYQPAQAGIGFNVTAVDSQMPSFEVAAQRKALLDEFERSGLFEMRFAALPGMKLSKLCQMGAAASAGGWAR